VDYRVFASGAEELMHAILLFYFFYFIIAQNSGYGVFLSIAVLQNCNF